MDGGSKEETHMFKVIFLSVYQMKIWFRVFWAYNMLYPELIPIIGKDHDAFFIGCIWNLIFAVVVGQFEYNIWFVD